MLVGLRCLPLGMVLAATLAATPSLERTTFAQADEAVERAEGAIAKGDVAVLTEVWSQVYDSFYDPQFKGLDWEAIGQRYRRLAQAPGADLSSIINAMLAELGASHTGYYTPAETAYYDLADIFSGGLRDELAEHFAGGEVSYAGIGMATRVIDGKHFVSGVFAGLPAEASGITVGDEIIAADGAPFEPVGSFVGKAGRKVNLKLRRQAHGSAESITVRPEVLRPNRMYRDAMEASARIIAAGDRKIGYVHIWSYARFQYQELLEELLTEGKLRDADALIWDLRDGWGGADPGYLDIFNPRSPTMTLTARSGARDIVNGKWRKPVVLLINGGTRSGKEVLAYGFKQYGLGPVVGTRSAGALLAGRAYLLSNGSLLLVAVADVSVEGNRLEGVGVAPDIIVPFDIRYAQGKDPQLARAIDVLTSKAGN